MTRKSHANLSQNKVEDYKEVSSPREMGQRTAERWFQRHTRVYHKEKEDTSAMPYYQMHKLRRFKRHGSKGQARVQTSKTDDTRADAEDKENQFESPYKQSNKVLSESEDEEAMFCAIC